MSKPPALLRQCENVLAGVADGAKHPPVLSWKRERRKWLGEIFWGHFHSNKRSRRVTSPILLASRFTAGASGFLKISQSLIHQSSAKS
jgi:hypothetical protein